MLEMNGVEVGKIYFDNLKNKIDKLDRKLTLAIILLSNDEASLSYLKGRENLANKLGINIKIVTFETLTKEILINKIQELNNDDLVDGIMIDRPYPSDIKEEEVVDYLDYRKDVDGVTSINSGLLTLNRKCLVPPTAASSFELIRHYLGSVEGKRALVIGRSSSVGKPLFQLLVNNNATVTLAHSRTKDLKTLAKSSEILCVAIGRREMIDEEYLNEEQCVVDVGIHYNEMGKLCGDVKESAKKMVKLATPVPKGVGALTNYKLFENLLLAYEMRKK